MTFIEISGGQSLVTSISCADLHKTALILRNVLFPQQCSVKLCHYINFIRRTVADSEFPIRGGANLVGERQLPIQLHFVEFVCQNKEVEPLGGAHTTVPPWIRQWWNKILNPIQSILSAKLFMGIRLACC